MNLAQRSSRPPLAPSTNLTLCARVSAEFLEMPGLRITLPQAARLFGLDAASCDSVLRTLVDSGVLMTDGHAFARSLDR
jgi:hypothetical protein